MHSDVVTDGSTQQLVEINQTPRYKRASILRGEHNQISLDCFCGLANAFPYIRIRDMQRVECYPEHACPLDGLIEQCVARA